MQNITEVTILKKILSSVTTNECHIVKIIKNNAMVLPKQKNSHVNVWML